ncbi:MAG: hypothetical protein ACFCUQ_05185 [Kiloniellales bacterium]
MTGRLIRLLPAAAIVAAWSCLAAAETPPLPAPDQVFAIAVKPQAKQHPDFFTPETLLAALPRMRPAALMAPIGGKIWAQSGVIVLKDGRVLFWRSYRDDLIAIETAGEPIIYAIAD